MLTDVAQKLRKGKDRLIFIQNANKSHTRYVAFQCLKYFYVSGGSGVVIAAKGSFVEMEKP